MSEYILTNEEQEKIKQDWERNQSLDNFLGNPIFMSKHKFLPDGPARDPDTTEHPRAARQLQVGRYEEFIQEYWNRILELDPDIPEKILANPKKKEVGNSHEAVKKAFAICKETKPIK